MTQAPAGARRLRLHGRLSPRKTAARRNHAQTDGPQTGHVARPVRVRRNGGRAMKTALAPEVARLQLNALGRLLYDADPKTLWDRDTATLPWTFRRLRRRYRDFAAAHIAPFALQADLDPHSFDV